MKIEIQNLKHLRLAAEILTFARERTTPFIDLTTDEDLAIVFDTLSKALTPSPEQK